MEMVEFFVLGEPVVKMRPRVVRGHAYTPEKTRTQEARIAAAYKDAHPGAWFGKGIPLRMELEFHMRIPESFGKKKRDAALMGALKPTVRNGDIENLAKLALDALNGVCYYDDSQVVELESVKVYGETPKTVIRVLPL